MSFWKNLFKGGDGGTGDASRPGAPEAAKKYRHLHAADSEPLSVIAAKLKDLDRVEAVDVGCGAGNYDLQLYKYLGDKLNLTCLDVEETTLAPLTDYFSRHNITHFSAKRSSAETMPFNDNSMDCVFTFNAVHNFNLPDFLKESARVLKTGGYLFIYTRLREQNETDIYGQNFPGYSEKDNRLFSLGTVKHAVETMDFMTIESVMFFAYSRMATLEQLMTRARERHNSTFVLYTPEELERALEGFAVNIRSQFPDPQQVQWFDENVLFVIRIGNKNSTDYLKIASSYRPTGTVF